MDLRSKNFSPHVFKYPHNFSDFIDIIFYNYHLYFMFLMVLLYLFFIVRGIGKKTYALYFSVMIPFSLFIIPIFGEYILFFPALYFSLFFLKRTSVIFDRWLLFASEIIPGIFIILIVFFIAFFSFIFVCFILPVILFLGVIFLLWMPFSWFSVIVLFSYLARASKKADDEISMKSLLICTVNISVYFLWSYWLFEGGSPFDIDF